METKGNINFVLVGARATGKTVYLTSLYLNTKTITAQDKKTIDYLKPMADMLNKGEEPSATAGNLHELMFNYKDEKFSSSIQIDDVDGHFIETLSDGDEHTQRERNKLKKNLELSEGIIFFFPYQKIFKEESIEKFNYQVDTIISILKKIHHNKSSLPIPAVIGVSKWDESPDYQNEYEVERASEYIENKKFLRLAKEKIESHFSKLKIIPLSAIGKDINDIKPYNLEKPIEFFLKETYTNWINEIDKLKENKEELFIFLSKIHFDIKLYENGKYDVLYKELENEYSKGVFKELDRVKTLELYNIFEKKNSHILDALLPKNRAKVIDMKNKLESTKRVKKWSSIAVASMLIGLAVVGSIVWNAKSMLIKNESELFSDIEMEYKTNNYENALENIKSYQSTYSTTLNLEHKQRVVDIKSSIEKAQLISKAKSIIEDTTFENIDEIEEIFTSFSEMGIDKPELLTALHTIKDKLSLDDSYVDFKNDLKNKSFGEAVIHIEQNWKKSFEKDNEQSIVKILNIKFNIEVEKLLKDISLIADIDEFNSLVKKINKINFLQEQTSMTKLAYKATLNIRNRAILDEKIKVQKIYSNLLNHGISRVGVTFGAEYEENEPLGFKCDEINGDIVLHIDSKKYDYRNGASCYHHKITWSDFSTYFKAVRYSVKVIEYDITSFNDEYNGNFILSENDLIKIYNNKLVKKDIGHGYFINLKK
jgi:hypothetical protein